MPIFTLHTTPKIRKILSSFLFVSFVSLLCCSAFCPSACAYTPYDSDGCFIVCGVVDVNSTGGIAPSCAPNFDQTQNTADIHGHECSAVYSDYYYEKLAYYEGFIRFIETPLNDISRVPWFDHRDSDYYGYEILLTEYPNKPYRDPTFTKYAWSPRIVLDLYDEDSACISRNCNTIFKKALCELLYLIQYNHDNIQQYVGELDIYTIDDGGLNVVARQTALKNTDEVIEKWCDAFFNDIEELLNAIEPDAHFKCAQEDRNLLKARMHEFLDLAASTCGYINDFKNEVMKISQAIHEDVNQTIAYITNHSTNESLYMGLKHAFQSLSEEDQMRFATGNITDDDVVNIVEVGLILNEVDGKSIYGVLNAYANKPLSPWSSDAKKFYNSYVIDDECFNTYFNDHWRILRDIAKQLQYDLMVVKIANDVEHFIEIQNEYYGDVPNDMAQKDRARITGEYVGEDWGFVLAYNNLWSYHFNRYVDFKLVPYYGTDLLDSFADGFDIGFSRGKDNAYQGRSIGNQERNLELLSYIYHNTNIIVDNMYQIIDNTKPSDSDLTFKIFGSSCSFLNVALKIGEMIVKKFV